MDKVFSYFNQFTHEIFVRNIDKKKFKTRVMKITMNRVMAIK